MNLTTNTRRWSALALIVTAQFMVILDVAIVNVALPTIQTKLHFSDTSLQWVISTYAIVFGGALLLGGRLADLLGRRRLFMTGVAVFTLGSLLSGLAWSEGALIVTRALQSPVVHRDIAVITSAETELSPPAQRFVRALHAHLS